MTATFDPLQQQWFLEQGALQALDHASRLGITACSVNALVSHTLGVNVLQGSVDTLTLARDQRVNITVCRGHRQGSASSSDCSESAIRETVERADSIARLTEEDPALGLADSALFPVKFPDLDLYHPWHIDSDEAVRIALDCERAGLAVGGISRSGGAHLENSQTVWVNANSEGFLHGYASSAHRLSCGLIAMDQKGMRQNSEYTLARAFDELMPAQAVGKLAADKTLVLRNPRPLKTGRYPVIFAPRMASGLVDLIVRALSGGAQYKGASFLRDTLGDPLLPTWMSLVERPHEPRGMRSAHYDSDCVKTRNNTFIENGQITSYLLSIYSGRRLMLPTTGNADGPHNLRLLAPTVTQDELLQRMGTGVIVTRLMGQGVNLLTGDYSRGAQGFWVENGEVKYPVEGFTIAGQLRDMLAGLQAIGDDIDTRGETHTGSWLIDSMTLAG